MKHFISCLIFCAQSCYASTDIETLSETQKTIPSDLVCYEGGSSFIDQLPKKYLEGAELAARENFVEAARLLCSEAITWKTGHLLNRIIERKEEDIIIDHLVENHKEDKKIYPYYIEPSDKLILRISSNQIIGINEFVDAIAKDLEYLRNTEFETWFKIQTTTYNRLDHRYSKMDFYKYYLLSLLGDGFLNYVQKA